MISGSVTLNNLTDHQLIQVMQAKESHEGKIFFDPTAISIMQSPKSSLNNNVRFSWNDDEGFKVMLDLCVSLKG